MNESIVAAHDSVIFCNFAPHLCDVMPILGFLGALGCAGLLIITIGCFFADWLRERDSWARKTSRVE